MANALGILAIIGAILAAITALVTFDFLLVVPAGYAVVAGIYIVLQVALQSRENILVFLGSAIAALVGLAVVLGTLMGWMAAGLATGLAVFANLEIAATALKSTWGELPQVGAFISVAALVIAAVLAIVFNTSLGFGSIIITMVVVVLSLVGIYPASIAARD